MCWFLRVPAATVCRSGEPDLLLLRAASLDAQCCVRWLFQAPCELNNGAGEHFQGRPQCAAEASRPDNRGECSPPHCAKR